jgi:lauroyl/myristoyl acyltransferase
MNLQALLSSRKAAVWVLSMCQTVPPTAALGVTRTLARLIAASRATPAVQAVRLNQNVVHGGSLDREQLDQAALQCWQFITLGFYELFHALKRPEQMPHRVAFPPMVEEIIQRSREARHGLVICGVHLTSFDFVAQATYLHGLQAHILSVPAPNETIAWQHELRRRVGMEIVDADVGTIRASIRRIQAGETLVTGIERPMPGLKHSLRFFGRPAYLPTHHISIGLRAGVPLVVFAPVRLADGSFTLYTTEYLNLKPYSDHEQEIVCNAEYVLEAAQELILQAPTQWGMTHPVWRDVPTL